MSKLEQIIEQVANFDYSTGGYFPISKPVEIKTHLPFAVFTFDAAWTNGFTLTLTNEDGDYWHIEEEEDEEIIDFLYNQICKRKTAIA